MEIMKEVRKKFCELDGKISPTSHKNYVFDVCPGGKDKKVIIRIINNISFNQLSLVTSCNISDLNKKEYS